MFDHLLESSHRDESNNCSNIFGEEIAQEESHKNSFYATYLEFDNDYSSTREDLNHWKTQGSR